MFTGIIKEIGRVQSFDKRGGVYRLTIAASQAGRDAVIGGSVAVNGVCLTIVDKSAASISFDVMEETVRRSNLAGLKSGDRVNLEDALRADGRLDGHFVLGHVDCIGRVVKREESESGVAFAIEVPSEWRHLVVEKGSVALDGISLTIGRIDASLFRVHLIPHTLKMTTMHLKKVGEMINVEFDIIGKYISRFKEIPNTSRLSESFLRSKGF